MSKDNTRAYNKKSVADIDVKGKKVLLRCDFNVPVDKETGKIRDEGRIVAALPTINYLLDNGAAVIACSHFGRPKGEFKPEFSLCDVADCLSKHLNRPVKMSKDVIGDDAMTLSQNIKPGEIMLLENTRFHPEEEKNDPEFAKKLASMADIFVSDAFGSVHRAHASTEGVSRFLPAVSGFLLNEELKYIGGAISDPKRPLVAILGGAKVSDKLAVISNLLKIADTVIIGGGMAYTFFKAEGGKIGNSLCEDEQLSSVLKCKAEAKERGVKLLLPVDSVAGAEFSNDVDPVVVDSGAIEDGMMAMDIGPAAIGEFVNEIKDAGTIVWNGPMGVFEFSKFAEGTRCIASAVANSNAISVIGGGDSAAAVRKFGVADKITHISTGGGASLEFMEGKALPGIVCLLDA